MNRIFKLGKYLTSGNFLLLFLKWFIIVSTLLLMLLIITCGLMVFDKTILTACGNIPIYVFFFLLSGLLSLQACLFCIVLRQK